MNNAQKKNNNNQMGAPAAAWSNIASYLFSAAFTSLSNKTENYYARTCSDRINQIVELHLNMQHDKWAINSNLTELRY